MLDNIYTPGTTLELNWLGASANIASLSDSIVVRIDHAFLPFTQSQAMRITVVSQPPGLHIPETAILKLYDRRLIDARQFDDTPWSVEREIASQARWKAIRAGELVEDTDLVDPDDYSEPQQEELHRRLCKNMFTKERDAYLRLSSSQGVMVPKLFASLVLTQGDITPRDVPEAYVYGHILEMFDGTPLDDLPPSTLEAGDFSRVGHELMAAVATFGLHGVIHNDIRSGNILLNPDTHRAILIDFGQSILKTTESDEQWNIRVDEEEEIEALRRILDSRDIRDCTPMIPDASYLGYYHFHHAIERRSERWRRRWYHPTGEGPVTKGEREPARWALTEECKAWLDSRPSPPESFKVPRPGSPASHYASLGE